LTGSGDSVGNTRSMIHAERFIISFLELY